MVTTLIAEDRLLLMCARSRVPEPADKIIKKLLSQPLDWDYVYRAAVNHKIAPLVYRSLCTVCADVLPDQSHEAFRDYNASVVLHSKLTAYELLRLMPLFNQAGGQVVTFKGPAIAMTAYGTLDLRYFEDIDLFVRPVDVERIRSVLQAQGYALATELDHDGERTLRKWSYSYIFRHQRNFTEVELHWRLSPTFLSFPVNIDQLWRRLVEVPLLNSTIRTFSPEDSLLILLMHGAKHYWSRLNWLCDINELLIAQPTLDWTYIMQQAHKLHIRRIALSGLLLSTTLLDTPVPDGLISQAEADHQVGLLVKQVNVWLFEKRLLPIHTFEGNAYQFRIREWWWDKFLYLRIKQPMMNMTGNEPTLPPIPTSDRRLYFFLLMMRYVRRFLVKVRSMLGRR